MTGPGQAEALAKIQQAAAEIARLRAREAEWTAERDRLIARAHGRGISLRRIADVAGVAHTSVAKIVAAATTVRDDATPDPEVTT